MSGNGSAGGITRARLAHDLRAAGLGEGQRVVVHSGLRSLGKVQGGADTVINALQEVLTPRGTLVMPAFTYSVQTWNNEPFDRDASPSRTGLITETFRQRPDVVRSDHPTHSFALWGADAEPVAADHADAVGRRSPLGWLLDRGGLIVQLGTDQATNTALHLCEELAEVPYLDVSFTAGQSFEVAHRRRADGSVETVRVAPVPGSSDGFPRVEPLLAHAGIVREARVAKARTLITSLPVLTGAVVPALREHPGLLLSTRPDDEVGQRRRAVIHADPARRTRDLIDLLIEGFPGGRRLTWPERESVEPEAQAAARQALEVISPGAAPNSSDLRRHLDGLGVTIEEHDTDAVAFSLWEPSEQRIRLWRGALARLAGAFGESDLPCAAPLRSLTESHLRELAIAHEGFHVLCPPRGCTARERLIEEIAARLFADELLQLPASALLIDAWLMHWAPETLATP